LHQADRPTTTTKTVRETEAEAVAFVVGKSIGLVTSTASAESNTFNYTLGNAIRLLSNLGAYDVYQEGVGAINVSVQSNTITGTGTDSDFPGGGDPYAAISSVGVWANGYLDGEINSGVTTQMVNYYVNIENNVVNSANQDCVLINSTENANVISNQCNDTNLATDGSPSIYLYYSNTGSIESNTRTDTGPITVSHAPNFTVQTTY
jgi:hypothetical protein